MHNFIIHKAENVSLFSVNFNLIVFIYIKEMTFFTSTHIFRSFIESTSIHSPVSVDPVLKPVCTQTHSSFVIHPRLVVLT